MLKLDSGVEIHLKSDFASEQDGVLERGFDDDKGI